MIMRLDRLIAEIPPPSDPDPKGASLVQELLGGKFGEMSTFMNYTYQRNRGDRPEAAPGGRPAQGADRRGRQQIGRLTPGSR